MSVSNEKTLDRLQSTNVDDVDGKAYEPDMYYFDYQSDGPSKRKQELTSSLLDVAVANYDEVAVTGNNARKAIPDSDTERSQFQSQSQSQYENAYSSSSYENEYVQSDYGNDYYGAEGNTGKGVWIEETDITGGLRPKIPKRGNQAGYALEDLVMKMIT